MSLLSKLDGANRQELLAASLDPPGTRLGLTIRAVSIPTGVVQDARGATVITGLLTPAQQGGAARRDRAEDDELHRREPMRATIGVAVGADDLCEGEPEGRDRSRRLCGDDTHRVTARARRVDPRDPAVNRARSACVEENGA